jgi:hypothetical protein
MTEKQLESLILEYLKHKRIMAWKNPPSATFQPDKKCFIKSKHARNGIPDISILIKGITYYCELKKPAKKPRSDEQLYKLLSDDQKSYITDLRANGATVFICDSVNKLIDELSKIWIQI